jgi:G3E family GTPase
LEAAVRDRNAGATITRAAAGEVEPELLLAPAADTAWVDVAARRASGHGFITTFTACFERPLRLGPFGLWLSLMTQMHGPSLLRVKGLVHAEGEDGPVVIDCVQHVIHPARYLAAWPDGDRRTRLVFVARGLAAGTIASLRRSLAESIGQPLVE